MPELGRSLKVTGLASTVHASCELELIKRPFDHHGGMTVSPEAVGLMVKSLSSGGVAGWFPFASLLGSGSVWPAVVILQQ